MWLRRVVPVLVLAATCAACADARHVDVDAAEPPDATPRPDAAPQPVVLTQVSDSSTITPGTSIGCVNNATGVARENSWYRAFTPSEHGVTGGFAVTSVLFAIEQAQAQAGGTQAVNVRLYRYTGFVGSTLDLGAMTQLADEQIQVADTGPKLQSVPIAGSIAAGDDLVVEIAVSDSDPDTDGNGSVFFVGANSGGQSKPPYLRAPTTGCDLPSPTQLTLVGAGFPTMHMVLTVTGLPTGQ